MKKITFLIITLLFCTFLFCACNSDTLTTPGANGTQGSQSTSYSKIDVDLTKMSGTVAYSQVYDMLNNMSKYEGKIIKMRGPFNALYSSSTGKYYPAVIIKDATACCSQGIEFILSGNPSYPSGYPSKNSEITVVGKFGTYKEGSSSYCHLVNAKIV